MSIQDLKSENEELKRKLLNQKCPLTEEEEENPLDKVNKLGLNLPENVKGLGFVEAKISECQVPSEYFGKTNKQNVKCKDALQTQIKHDRDVSKLLIGLLTVVLPLMFIFFSISNPTKLNFVHYILLFIIISLSVITIASTQGKALSSKWIIWPEKTDCNTCQYNAKLPVIGVLVGICIAVSAYIIDWVRKFIK